MSTTAEAQITAKVGYFMPDSLKRILEREWPALENGLKSQPVLAFLDPAGRRKAEEALQREMRLISRLLRSRPRFSDLAREFGKTARILIFLNLPEGDGMTASDFDSLLRYLEKNTPKFPLVVYDDPGKEPGSLREFLEEIRGRRLRLSERYREAYPRGLGAYPEEVFDARSPLFGIASLSFSHSVNDIARLWLWAWKSANGDMAGRPIPEL